MQRRVANPVLTWNPVGPGRIYRVTVRDEDSGVRRLIYEGVQTTCRVPGEVRATPHQLSYRVQARIDEPLARYKRVTPYIGLDRTGDDFDTPAPDLITYPATKGADLYRFSVIDRETGERLTDFCRPDPAFLLPAGRLADRDCLWRCSARTIAGWRNWIEGAVTGEMVSAARDRAAREVEEARSVTVLTVENDARAGPGRADRLAPAAAPSSAPQFLPIVDVTADPSLASGPNAAAVFREQWLDADSAVQRTVAALETHGFRGLFFIDVFAAEALGDGPLEALSADLIARGHGLGALINPDPWMPVWTSGSALPGDPAKALVEAVKLFERRCGRRPRAVRMATAFIDEAALDSFAAAGAELLFIDSVQQRAMPRWMQTRTGPFMTYTGLSVVPVTRILSAPAHPRDRALRHGLSASDPFMSAAAATVLGEGARHGERFAWPFITHIDPLRLVVRETRRSVGEAAAWNAALERHAPDWIAAGWGRKETGFHVNGGPDEVAGDLLDAMLAGARKAGLSAFDFDEDLSPACLRRWTETRAWEPVVQHLRGPRLSRLSALRVYDASLRLALMAEERT